METIYWEYYHPNPNEFKKMKDEAIFVFDSSSMLDIYVLPQTTIDSLFKKMKSLSKKRRIWIPHQFGQEYHKNKVKKVVEQREYSDLICKNLDQCHSAFTSKLISQYQEHYLIDRNVILQKISSLVQEAKLDVKKKLSKRPDWIANDAVCKELEKIFEDNIGTAYTGGKYAEMVQKTEERIRQKKQPGISDSKGPNSADKVNGDALGWLQIIDYASKIKKPIILITEEKKPDFWEERKILDGTFPQRSLIREIYDESGQLFYILNTLDFLKFVSNKNYIPMYSSISNSNKKATKKSQRNQKVDGVVEIVSNPEIQSSSSVITIEEAGEQTI